MSRCLVIINPVSGGGAARRYALDLQWKLSTLFDTIEVKFTTGADDATHFAKAAVKMVLTPFSAWAAMVPLTKR